MLYAHRLDGGRLRPLKPEEDLAAAIWIDLHGPDEGEVQRVEALGVMVPTLEDMEEIEISNRLYHEAEAGADYMTAVIPGLTAEQEQAAAPACFILTRERLVTVRHHRPRPFETFADRAERSAAGCASADRLFLGLVEEIVARQADLLEAAGKVMDATAQGVFRGQNRRSPDELQAALERIGREGEMLARVRLGLLTMERMLSYYGQTLNHRREAEEIRDVVKGEMRDLQALEVHADFLANRVGQITDATLGLINLAQNATVRIVSVVAALFLPPTLIASIYGMNFDRMPELHRDWGYPAALGLMVASALATYLYFRWKRWL